MINKKSIGVIVLLTTFVISLSGIGIAQTGKQPSPPHRVVGDVTYEDGSMAAGVTINFKNDSDLIGGMK